MRKVAAGSGTAVRHPSIQPRQILGVIAATPVLLVGAVVLGAQPGTVTRVIDGDTIVVDPVGAVRLIGVDTPEAGDPREPVQYFGREATAFARRLAEGRPVRLEFEGVRKDKYDRTLAYVYLPDGTSLNAELIRQGYAHAYTQFPFSRLEEFLALQREAIEHGRGFWGVSAGRSSQSSASVVPVEATAAKQDNTATETVYATRTGSKYHRAGCRHLARSQIPLPLKDAVLRYGACSVCNPPTLTAGPSVASAVGVSSAQSAKPAAASGQCRAMTRKGTQCSRKAQPGRQYCWQH